MNGGHGWNFETEEDVEVACETLVLGTVLWLVKMPIAELREWRDIPIGAVGITEPVWNEEHQCYLSNDYGPPDLYLEFGDLGHEA